jgi:hypothetical protein
MAPYGALVEYDTPEFNDVSEATAAPVPLIGVWNVVPSDGAAQKIIAEVLNTSE